MRAEDHERLDAIESCLKEALQRPITGEVWPGLAAAALERFDDVPILRAFAEKGLETLEDLERHDRLAVSPAEPRIAVWFVAWSGTHLEVQPQRYGEYLTMLLSAAHRVRERGIELAGFLEMDAYLRGEASPGSREESLEVDIELSFVPGIFLGYPAEDPNPFPTLFQINGGLCTDQEMSSLRAASG
jgi:hypothetical protein